jgi:quercetin dioxygenase-like cupin family protein
MKLPLCFVSLVVALVTFGAEPVPNKYTPPAQTNPLATTFVAWDSLPVRTTANGEARAVFDNPTPTLEKFEMHITTLKPGASSHPVHHHPWEEMLLVKEGTLEASLNGEKHRAGAGSLIFLASHDPHNVTNVGETPATYYVINFVTDVVRSTPDQPAAQQKVPGMLATGIFDCENLPAKPNASGSRISVLDSPSITFQRVESHVTTLNTGQSTQLNMIDAGDELFIVKSGKLEATVNGITARLNEGSFFYCAPNDKRTFKALGNAPASYQVIKVISAKSPKP